MPAPITAPRSKMSEFPGEGGISPSETGGNHEVTNIMDSLPSKRMFNRLNTPQPSTAACSTASQMMSSSHVSKRSQVLHHSVSSTEMSNMAASSSTASSASSSSATSTSSSAPTLKHGRSQQELKASLSELQSSMSEMRSGLNVKVNGTVGGVAGKLLASSLEGIDEADLTRVTPGDGDLEVTGLGEAAVAGIPVSASAKELKFQQTRTSSASSTKIIADGYSSEEAVANSAQTKRLEADGLSYEEKKASAAMRARLEMDGMTAEKAAAVQQEQRSLKSGDVQQQESRSSSAATMKLTTDNVSAEKVAVSSQQQRQTMTSGRFNQERYSSSASQSKLTINAQSIRRETANAVVPSTGPTYGATGLHDPELLSALEDLDQLRLSGAGSVDLEQTLSKYSGLMLHCVERLKSMEETIMPRYLDQVSSMMRKAWALPYHGHALGYSLAAVLRNTGGLDLLIQHCTSVNADLQLSSAQLLQECFTSETRGYVIERGLKQVVKAACAHAEKDLPTTPTQMCVGTGLLEHLFQHSEGTCSEVVTLGGLKALVQACRTTDEATLLHCAGALANLSLYGGAENQEVMLQAQVPLWLFYLATNKDDSIKYYACLAIAVMATNKEIEAAILKSDSFNLVEPFVASHNPFEFANVCSAHRHGQSQDWLQRLVPVLSSKREEARNLAAFHFCMEAVIKKKLNQTEIFHQIGSVEPLKRVASSPNAIASRYAAQALRLLGLEVPHKLSQQVPLWSTEDVREWVKQIGFAQVCQSFEDSKVDGDLLLQLTEDNLRTDIGLKNAILVKRFLRELNELKKIADYSSCDKNRLGEFLQRIDPVLGIYTYPMLKAGVDLEGLKLLSEDQLLSECAISNSIHRMRILDVVRDTLPTELPDCSGKTLDVFISYRRSTGSQLASLLKVHLFLRGFSVFIDVERLEAGKFENSLMDNIRKARHFILVLTPSALDRCIGDEEGKDWVHREIVTAIDAGCKIIPIIDSFQFPEPEELPPDMRAVCYFNGIRNRLQQGHRSPRSASPRGGSPRSGSPTPTSWLSKRIGAGGPNGPTSHHGRSCSPPSRLSPSPNRPFLPVSPLVQRRSDTRAPWTFQRKRGWVMMPDRETGDVSLEYMRRSRSLDTGLDDEPSWNSSSDSAHTSAQQQELSPPATVLVVPPAGEDGSASNRGGIDLASRNSECETLNTLKITYLTLPDSTSVSQDSLQQSAADSGNEERCREDEFLIARPETVQVIPTSPTRLLSVSVGDLHKVKAASTIARAIRLSQLQGSGASPQLNLRKQNSQDKEKKEERKEQRRREEQEEKREQRRREEQEEERATAQEQEEVGEDEENDNGHDPVRRTPSFVDRCVTKVKNLMGK